MKKLMIGAFALLSAPMAFAQASGGGTSSTGSQTDNTPDNPARLERDKDIAKQRAKKLKKAREAKGENWDANHNSAGMVRSGGTDGAGENGHVGKDTATRRIGGSTPMAKDKLDSTSGSSTGVSSGTGAASSDQGRVGTGDAPQNTDSANGGTGGNGSQGNKDSDSKNK